MVELGSARAFHAGFEIISNQGVEEMDINIKDMLPYFWPRTRNAK